MRVIPSCHHDMKPISMLLALCEGNPLVTSGLLSQRSSYAEFRCLLCCYHKQAVEETVEKPMIWEAITLMWWHCNSLAIDDFKYFAAKILSKKKNCWQDVAKSCGTPIVKRFDYITLEVLDGCRFNRDALQVDEKRRRFSEWWWMMNGSSTWQAKWL